MSSISNLGTTGINNLLWPQDNTNADGSTNPTASSPIDTVSISGPGQLLSELQQLQSTDPDKLKQVASDIAQQLQSAAQQQGQQTGFGQFLDNLAGKFENIANGGDLSQLQPGQQVHGHGHGHHHHSYDSNGQSVDPTSPTSATGDPIDQLLASIAGTVSQALQS
ncbi:MAG TPA: hypothetical protein VFE62_14520 [Gemmataceae bacterium]|nr:hypothetical protein [Gemmataceae bacterium]